MVNFILTGLNSDVGLDTKPSFESYTAPTLGSFDFILSLDIKKNIINGIFYIETSDPTLDGDNVGEEANDVLYYTVPAEWAKLKDETNPLLFSEGAISGGNSGTYQVTKQTKFMGPAFLAYQITGGYNNSDIFNNEAELVQQYVDLDDDINTAITNKLTTGGVSSSKLDNSTNTTANISREIFLRLINSTDANDKKKVFDAIAATDNAAVPLNVFRTDDTIEFILTYNVSGISQGGNNTPAVDAANNALGTNPITDQKFKVILTVKD